MHLHAPPHNTPKGEDGGGMEGRHLPAHLALVLIYFWIVETHRLVCMNSVLPESSQKCQLWLRQ